MYCPYCHTELPENTTVCCNCGNSIAQKKKYLTCDKCGYSGPLFTRKSFQFTALDWLVTILFFPFGILYMIGAIKVRKNLQIWVKCPKCKKIIKFNK